MFFLVKHHKERSHMIFYKKPRHYKYTLFADYQHPTNIWPSHSISTRFIDLDLNGLLTIKKAMLGMAASGPDFDTKNIMRGSLGS